MTIGIEGQWRTDWPRRAGPSPDPLSPSRTVLTQTQAQEEVGQLVIDREWPSQLAQLLMTQPSDSQTADNQLMTQTSRWTRQLIEDWPDPIDGKDGPLTQ